MSKSTFKAHPWHGVSPGQAAPDLVTCFIEIVPTDTVKYEIDKESGYLKIDRPQKYSNLCPMLYGFIPRSYCGEKVGNYCKEKTKSNTQIYGDKDPLDICILTEKTIPHGDILVQATPIGGLRMIDANQADDKIIATLKDDAVYGHIRDIKELPSALVDRLKHYFLTYKQLPNQNNVQVTIAEVYNSVEAKKVIELSLEDYKNNFSELASL